MTMLTFDKTQIIRNRILEFSGEKTKATFLKNISTYCLLQFY